MKGRLKGLLIGIGIFACVALLPLVYMIIKK